MNSLSVFFVYRIPVYDDDGCTFVEERQGKVILGEDKRGWKKAIRDTKEKFDQMYELQTGPV